MLTGIASSTSVCLIDYDAHFCSAMNGYKVVKVASLCFLHFR